MGEVIKIILIPIISIILLAILTVIMERSSKIKKKYISSIIVFSVGILTLIIFFISVNSNTSSKEKEVVADGFTIQSYNVNLDIKEDNKVDVTETVTVNFYESGHRGINKITPIWLEYTGQDGKTISRKSEIYNLQAIGENYTLYSKNKKKGITIGDSNTYLPLGPHEYVIKYTYDMGNDPYEGFDEFIFHAYGDYWGTRINNASLTINMPSNFNANKIKFFNDKYRKKDITKNINYHVNGNTITANVSNNYELYKSLTVDIELPDNYFIQGENNYGIMSTLLCLIIISFSIISFIKWSRFGKDYDKQSQTVEFYPPENLDASEIGYIYGKENTKKLTIALIIALASKGLIKIEEQNNNERIIKKKREKLKKDKITMDDIYEEIERCITVKLSNNYDPQKATSEEKNLIEDMFKDSNEFIIKRNYDLFYEEYNELITKKYIIIEKDTINDYTKVDLENTKKGLEEKYNIDKDFPTLTENEDRVYNNLFNAGNETNLRVNTTFYQTFATIGSNLEKKLDEKIRDAESYKKMKSTSILFLIGTILWILSYSVFEDMNPNIKILYTISFIALLVIAVFMFLMSRKTAYGEMITARVLGFRNYIETAEKDRINALVMENPNYFYDILPYAYVLGVSKKWIEKFEDIPVPVNDMGNFDYLNINSFNDLSDSVYISPSSSGSSSGGCSSCGGGCSSCGGGCSSCGGGGSW